jgi:1-acyl-sn-glycerol-3-phosphate acyltransferase
MATFNQNSLKASGWLFFNLIATIYQGIFFCKHPIVAKGKENLPKKGAYVLVANHLSDSDPPAIGIQVGKPVAFMAKEELFERPIFGRVIALLGAISIDREKPEPSTFKAIRQVLKSGRPILTFIEGTRSRTPGVLGIPHTGPAYLARSNKVPIVPVSIVGSNDRTSKIYVTFGKPMQPGADLDETSWRIMEEISKLSGFKLPPRESSNHNQ